MPWTWPVGGAARSWEPSFTRTAELSPPPQAGGTPSSWIFGHRLRAAGLLGSMGRVVSSVDNGLMESFWCTMQRELLDRRSWSTRAELGSAMFDGGTSYEVGED